MKTAWCKADSPTGMVPKNLHKTIWLSATTFSVLTQDSNNRTMLQTDA